MFDGLNPEAILLTYALTRELGWKSDLAIQQEMKREVDAMRIATADRHIAKGLERLNNTIDLRAGSAESTFLPDSSMNRHILIGRMKYLEKMGLAQSKYEGLWRVEKDAFETLGKIEQREQLTKEIHVAMERANIKRPVRPHDGRESFDGSLSNLRVIGRVIAKTLGHDEGMDADTKGGGNQIPPDEAIKAAVKSKDEASRVLVLLYSTTFPLVMITSFNLD